MAPRFVTAVPWGCPVIVVNALFNAPGDGGMERNFAA